MAAGPSRREKAAVVALASRTHRSWHLLARALEELGSALPLAAGTRPGWLSEELLAETEPGPVPERLLDRLEQQVGELEAGGVSLLTVLDDSYPTNLRLVYDRPPFLFVRGRLLDEDQRSIAVVGTRKASEAGLEQAERLARGLIAQDVTVVSGLALGIDGAAHRAALAAGGRTLAVLGNGIRRPVYPPGHGRLADQIVAAGGAVISQFLPDAPPRPDNFRLRNRTMSGLALGTAVVEAGPTSGARMQARFALEHGKRVFLHRDLVTREPWSARFVDHPGATVVDDADEILAVVERLAVTADQQTLAV